MTNWLITLPRLLAGLIGILSSAWAAELQCTPQVSHVTQPLVAAQPERADRPQLSDTVAERYRPEQVLAWHSAADGSLQHAPWAPWDDACMSGTLQGDADYRVDASQPGDGRTRFTSVQAALNQAVRDVEAQGRRERVYIELLAGDYAELLYVPALSAPITLFSRAAQPSQTRIHARIDAGMPGREYAQRFAAQFADAPPSVVAMHASLVAKGEANIGTSGSALAWVRNHGFQLRNLTLANDYNEDRGTCDAPCVVNAHGQFSTGNHQAVTLLIDAADRVQAEQIRLLGNQDTLYFKSATVGRTVRSYFRHSYIEGDVDFIFGRATAYIAASEIRSLGVRTGTGHALAPSTHLRTPYGIVVADSLFSSDGLLAPGSSYLARQWFEGQKCSPYGTAAAQCQIASDAGSTQNDASHISRGVLEAVGKAVVLRSRLGRHLARAPWADWNSKPSASSYRQATYDSADFLAKLTAAGHDITALGYADLPAEPFLAEYRNQLAD